MENNRLNIISHEVKEEPNRLYAGGKMRRHEVQAHFDRLWLVDAESMDPTRNCMERERLERTMQLIKKSVSLEKARVVDLGCGLGALTRLVRDAGAHVDAVDISSVALKKLQEYDTRNIQPIQDYVPMTTLKDDTYDLVVCTELIGDMNPDEHRLLFSELARLVKAGGYIICSTALDINSEDALHRFRELAETEIQIEHWSLSYHRCYIRLKDFFEAPSRFVKGSRDPEYRRRQLQQRTSVSKAWYNFNSHQVPALFWTVMQWICKPVVYTLKQNRSILLYLEKFCRFFWSEAGISEAILIGKRKPLFVKVPPKEIPRETKHKKQVWE